MRITVTLDDDVAAKLKAAARRSGKALRDVVNDTLRVGLMAPQGSRSPFRVKARSLGGVQPGIRLDNVSDLLERIEGTPPGPKGLGLR